MPANQLGASGPQKIIGRLRKSGDRCVHLVVQELTTRQCSMQACSLPVSHRQDLFALWMQAYGHGMIPCNSHRCDFNISRPWDRFFTNHYYSLFCCPSTHVAQATRPTPTSMPHPQRCDLSVLVEGVGVCVTSEQKKKKPVVPVSVRSGLRGGDVHERYFINR